jgi:hypothetical protein
MKETFRVPINQPLTQEKPRTWVDFAEASPFAAPSVQELRLGSSELATRLSTCVRLDWEDLQCFDVVDRQFEQLGVTFANAVALRPSNPAYPPYSGMMVLMSAPKSGWLEVTFLRPVQFVCGFVTSSRRTVATAFNALNQPIAQAETLEANLAHENASSANAQLNLSAADIHRVTFHVFNGQLTLDDLCFSF